MQPHRVGSFSGGPANLQGAPYFLYGAPYIRYKSRGASILAGGAPAPGVPADATGLHVRLNITVSTHNYGMSVF